MDNRLTEEEHATSTLPSLPTQQLCLPPFTPAHTVPELAPSPLYAFDPSYLIQASEPASLIAQPSELPDCTLGAPDEQAEHLRSDSPFQIDESALQIDAEAHITDAQSSDFATLRPPIHEATLQMLALQSQVAQATSFMTTNQQPAFLGHAPPPMFQFAVDANAGRAALDSQENALARLQLMQRRQHTLRRF